jgi:hypothetical protein
VPLSVSGRCRGLLPLYSPPSLQADVMLRLPVILQITSLIMRSAIQGSSDATPCFVQALNHQWLPNLPHLTSLTLTNCALHSAETRFHCAAGPSGMRGGVGPMESCQFADLAAAAPNLTALDLSGNFLTRVPDEGFEYGPSPSAPMAMGFLLAMIDALPVSAISRACCC